MKNIIFQIFLVIFLLLPFEAKSKISVMTTTSDLKNIVEKVGGEKVEVDSFCKGTQDPHFLEAKPSFMLKASKTDLLVSNGLGLEEGWLPLIIKGSRNPKIREGQIGNFIAGNYIEPLEKVTGTISRLEGDVHPEGNPHFLLDPKNSILVAEKIKEKLKELDPEHSSFYDDNYIKFSKELSSKLENWRKRIGANVKVITYHKTLTYFFHRFEIQNISILEPKPGIPPTASHILGVMKKAKQEGVKLVLVENYFDPTIANRVAKEVQSLRVKNVPVSVGGESNILNIIDLYEKLVQTIEEK